MSNDTLCPVSDNSPQEDRYCYLTHFGGLFLSILGAVILLIYCFYRSDLTDLMSCFLYSVTLISVYAASTVYHRCTEISRKIFLQKLDHICIYLLIAGTYTPFALGPLRDNGGWNLFFIIWSIAFLGILFKLCFKKKFKAISLLSYLLMSWLSAYYLPDIQEQVSPTSFYWLVFGGISYTIGTIFFMWEDLKFNHTIWHLFVMGGSTGQFFSIFLMI